MIVKVPYCTAYVDPKTVRAVTFDPRDELPIVLHVETNTGKLVPLYCPLESHMEEEDGQINEVVAKGIILTIVEMVNKHNTEPLHVPFDTLMVDVPAEVLEQCRTNQKLEDGLNPLSNPPNEVPSKMRPFPDL